MKKYLLPLFLIVGLVLSFSVKAQVVSIPRDGFPYCESFMGSPSELRSETILGPVSSDPLINSASVGSGYLTLTNNDPNQSGFAYIDIPFSTEYGIKASFEYASYGGSGADGFTFFLFDGRYGELSNGADFPFQIGGFGGSLGYAQKTWPLTSLSDGLSGAYMGIGFDEWGNFVRKFEKHPAGGISDGFNSPYGLGDNPSNPQGTYPHTITIRGPETVPLPFVPYGYVAHQQVNQAPFPFKIDSDDLVFDNCGDPDYRKVFINLEPDPAGVYEYLITVQVKVGSEPVPYTIFDKLPYNFEAPEEIKIGFAAASGANRNFHLIRNLAVDVSTSGNVDRPVVSTANKEVCYEDDASITIDDVNFNNSGASFIQCVQVHDPELLASGGGIGGTGQPWNQTTAGVDFLNCGPTDICNTCDPSEALFFQSYDTNGDLLGEFEVLPLGDIEVDANGNPLQNVNDIEVIFRPDPNLPPSTEIRYAEVLYTVQDNFGIYSLPELIRVSIMPNPVITDSDTQNPTCDSQSDGSISVSVEGLIRNASYQWLFRPVGSSDPFTALGSETSIQNINNLGEAQIELLNIGLGEYVLEILNPLDPDDLSKGTCPERMDAIIIQEEDGTPVEATDVSICQETDAVLIPSVQAGFSNNTSGTPTFRWYDNPTRAGGPLIPNGDDQIDGVDVTISTGADGELTITGLTAQSATQDRVYTLYLEAAPQDDFCSFLDVGRLVPVEITVVPPLSISTDITPDWCREGAGAIEITAVGGSGDKTFTLFDDGNNQVGIPQVGATSTTFTGLLPGDYTVEIESSNPTCFFPQPVTILGPEDDLTIAAVDQTEATCDQDNGTFTFEVSGGNGTLSVASMSISGGISAGPPSVDPTDPAIFTFSGLAPGIPYTVTVTDEKGCTAFVDFTINEIQTPVFSINAPADACEDQASLDFTVDYDFFEIQATAVPEFNWYENQTGGTAIPNGTGPFGMDYQIDNSTGALTITNLIEGNYILWLEMGGPDACNLPRLSVTFEVFSLPIADPSTIQNVSCFGGTDGSIQVNISNGNPDDFLYELKGDNGVFIPFTDNFGFFDELPSGTYDIFVRNKVTGCEIVADPEVISEPTELVVNQGPIVDPSCALDNGSLEFTVLGGTPKGDGSYDITVNGQPIAEFNVTVVTQGDGSNLIQLVDLADDTYDIQITDANDCTVPTSFTLTAQILPEYSLTDVSVCLNETAEILPTIVNPGVPDANPVFNWYKDAGATQEIINGPDTGLELTFDVDNSTGRLTISDFSNSGTYTFYLKPAILNGCDLTPTPVEVQVNPLPSPVFEPVSISCFGGSDGAIRLVSGGIPEYTYTLQGGGSTYNSATEQFENLAEGTYVVEVVNSVTGCQAEFTVQVDEPTELVVNQGPIVDPSCGQDNGSLEFTVLGGTPKGDGTYDIRVNSLPIADFNATVVPQGDGSNLIQLVDLADDTYDIEITDVNGCSVPTSFTLTAQILPEYTLTDVSVCLNETAEILPTIVNPGVPDANPVFNWYKDAGATQEIINGPDTGLELTFDVDNSTGRLTISDFTNSGTYTFYLKPAILNGCDLTPIPVEVTVNPIPEVVFESDPASCFGQSDGQIRVVSGGNASYTYTISSGGQNNTGSFSGLAAGVYQIEIEDGIGCATTVDVEVTQPDDLQIVDIESTNPTCGDFNGEIVFEIQGGTPDYTVTINSSPLSDFSHQINGNRYTVQALEPGTYSISVEDNNACVDTKSDLFALINNDGLEINSQPISDAICEGGQAVLVPQLTIPAGAVPVLRWYFDSNATQEIVSNPNPAADGNIYQISPSGNLLIDNLPAGNYQYYLRISGDQICTRITEAELIVNEAISADIEAIPITCFGDTDGQIILDNLNGGNGNFEFSLNGGPWQTATTFTGLAPATYEVRVRDTSGNNGCGLTLSTVVESPDSPITINTPDLIRSSCDLENGAIRNLIVAGGWGNYSFEWRKDDPVSGQLLTQGTIDGIEDLGPGFYFLTITDAEGCTDTFNFEIEESSDPVYQVVPPINSCFGTPIDIRPIHLAPDPALPPAAATEVRWYKEPGQSGLIANGPDPGDSNVIYTIDDSDWLNPELQIENLPVGDHDFYFYVVCTGQEIRIEITVFDTPQIEIETDPITCFGDTNGKIRILSGHLDSYVYQLDGGTNLTRSDLEDLSLLAGIYQLTVTTPAGCPQELQVEIEGPNEPLAIDDLAQIDPGCGSANGKITGTIIGGYAPFEVQLFKNGTQLDVFSGVQSSIDIDGLTLGDYYLVIVDAEGCTITSSTLTLVDGPTQILVDDAEICEGESVTLTPVLDPAVPVATYFWSFDQAGNNLINSSPTPAPDGRIYQINSQGQLTISGLPVSNQPYTYYVTAEGTGVCLGFVAAPEVRVFDTPTATASIQNEVCFGEGGQITINATGGGGNYEYSLDGGNTFQTSNVFDRPVGVYELTLRSSSGCQFVLSNIEIEGPDDPIEVIDLVGKNASCNLDNGEISFTVIGGYGGYQVRSFKDGISIGIGATNAAGEFTIGGLGIGEYSFEIIDSQGCVFQISSPLELVEEPTQIVVDDTEICQGETAQLSPTINSNSPNPVFQWYFDSQANNPINPGTTSGVTYSIGADGDLSIDGLSSRDTPYTFYVLASGIGICGLEPKPASVIVNEIPDLRVSNPSVVCDPQGSVDLTQFIEGFNPEVYDYNVLSPSGAAMQINELGAVSVSGDYRVSSSLKNKSCWNNPQRIKVIIADELLVSEFQYEVDLGGGQILQNGDIQIQEDVQFVDESVGKVIIWNWDFGDGNTSSDQNPIHQYQKKGTYTVTLTAIDEFGCESVFERIVTVFDDYIVIVPNAFTPTGSKNQFFKPKYRGIASMELYIFNTWGELIFQSSSLETQGWDGTLNGKEVPNGNYVYRAIFTSRSGEKFEKSGVFLLIR